MCGNSCLDHWPETDQVRQALVAYMATIRLPLGDHSLSVATCSSSINYLFVAITYRTTYAVAFLTSKTVQRPKGATHTGAHRVGALHYAPSPPYAA